MRWTSCTQCSLLKGIRLEDDPSSSLQSLLDLWDKAPFEKIEIGYEVILVFFYLIGIEIGKKGVDLYSHLFG